MAKRKPLTIAPPPEALESPARPTKAELLAHVSGFYDIQKLRIQFGNRICALYRNEQGQKPGENDEEMDDDAKNLLATLRSSFTRITDVLVMTGKFEKDDLISSLSAYYLISHYNNLTTAEAIELKRINELLDTIPIWNDYLSKIKGVGPTMGAVILAYLDPYKAPRPSSFHAYCGMDVVSKWVLHEHCVTPDFAYALTPPENAKILTFDAASGAMIPDPAWRHNLPPHGTVTLHRDAANPNLLTIVRTVDGQSEHITYRRETSGGRSRRAEHLIDRDYIDKDGNPATRKSLTFTPFLKTKLLGVLGPSFLRSKSPYRAHYDAYKDRCAVNPAWAEARKAHIHNAAIRYMVKQFLNDLWVYWRTSEGLPVCIPYQEAYAALPTAPNTLIEGGA